MSCECNTCTEDREFHQVMESGDIERIKAQAVKWHERSFHAEDSLNWYQAIHDGSWPSAVEILSRDLVKAAALLVERTHDQKR